MEMRNICICNRQGSEYKRYIMRSYKKIFDCATFLTLIKSFLSLDRFDLSTLRGRSDKLNAVFMVCYVRDMPRENDR